VAPCGPLATATDPIGSVEHEFGTLMLNLTRYKHQVDGSRLDRMALTVLGTLAQCGPARLTTVAERIGFDPSTVSRQVADLEKAGLLSRAADPADRRAILLETTTEGQNLMARLIEGRRKRLERLLTDWSDTDITTLANLLGRLNEATDKYGPTNARELEQELNNG
jgi:DNA-binding MarR family transcriptional regulator